jgi:hypothetical protein
MKDLRAVKDKDIKELVKKHGWTFFETSAKERINVEESFNAAVKSIISWRKEVEDQEEQEIGGEQTSDSAAKKKKFSLKGLFKKKK